MTINERVSDERIANLIEVLSFYSPEDKHLANNEAELASALRELQQYRAAAACPAVWVRYGDANHAPDCTLDNDEAREWAARGLDVVRMVSPINAAPQVTSVPDEHYRQLSDLYHAQEKRLFKLAQRIKGLSFDKYAYSPSQAIDALEAAIFGDKEECGMAAAPAVQAEPLSVDALANVLRNAPDAPCDNQGKKRVKCIGQQLSGNTEPVNQPTLPDHSPCADAPDHIWLQTAGEWPASGEFGELTWSCDNQHPDDTLYVRADLVGNFPCYLQGYKDGCEWSALMAEANHPQTGDWLFDDPIELAKAIRKGPDMLPAEPGNSPAIPDGYALVPIRLTAENGAKELLSGEFSETKFISCPECFGDDECETCDGSGRIEITVPVSWTTIKEIWAKGVAHFAAAPQQEAE